ncbi:MAG TPA: 2-phospho-L-lactate transferase [Acidimicrobiales bacterium]|nr:2-phospho-L-lactate transferase [Acidimicrobiales bacterium]
MITVLAGGVGAARFLSGLVQVVPPEQITAVVNVGDDVILHGLHISPDLDTVTYTLAGAIDSARGWGLGGETWQALDMVRRYGGVGWFNLGDRDLGTHLYRTQRLHEGAALSTVTREIARAWDLAVDIVPVTDDRVETRVTVIEGDTTHEIGFQQYFVQLRHSVPVQAVRFVGADDARPAPGVVDAIMSADVLVIAPSNPLVSIDPVLAVPGIRAAVESRRARCVAVSPIVAGAALKGPADRMMTELGHESSVVGVARLYRELARALVIDDADDANSGAVRDAGMVPVVCDTIMAEPARAARLAQRVLDAAH